MNFLKDLKIKKYHFNFNKQAIDYYLSFDYKLYIYKFEIFLSKLRYKSSILLFELVKVIYIYECTPQKKVDTF